MEENLLEDLVLKEIDAAKKRIEAAELLFEDEKYIDAVNRIYYSVFHAGRALLLSIGKETKTHTGLISEIGFHFIEKKIIDKKFGIILRRLYESRETSDYVIGAIFGEDEVEEMIKNAKSFIEESEKVALDNVKKYK